MSALSRFHPIVAQWFLEEIGPPTGVQEKSWQRIAGGQHILITAPTGSGKTLAAFLWAINQLVTGRFPTGHTSVLYVSPLRALNNDIQRNLLAPLAELSEAFRKAGAQFPHIRVLTRSGDTPQSERGQMQRHPPEILITTPESLNLMLSSAGGRSIVRSIATLILDEVHAVFGNKRGVHLMSAVERLVLLSGEFQRIALSATIRPLETVAGFVGGFRLEDGVHDARYLPRPVAVIRPDSAKQYDIRVRSIKELADQQPQDSVWGPLAREFREIIRGNRSTLLFANSRSLCEKLALRINEGEDGPVAYVHHGSLSREIRSEVERRLREGELRAVVATNSLELGIDIGSLDEVILVQSPPSVSSAIQRLGRAGHEVGMVARGQVFPTHPQDLLEAAVLARAIPEQDMELNRPVLCPLDVLAQVIVSMVGVDRWDIDELYARLRTSYPYHDLGREQFDLVLNMLAGRYADTRIRELRPRVSLDRMDNSVVARKGALLALYTSGGTIPDRGYFRLRHQETGALIGELDEEFVWEASVGQTFALGTQNWRIDRVTHNDVFVVPGNPRITATPFWKGEENYRDFHFSERIGELLELADRSLDDPAFMALLTQDHHMGPIAAEQLVGFLKRQKERTGCDLPHRRHVLVEQVGSGPGGVPGNQLVLHTTWGGRINRPLAMALDAAWDARFGQHLETFTGNDCIVIQLPHEVSGEDVLALVSSTNVEHLLRKRLEHSGFFGARFRECAGRALLVTRNRIGERMPLWMTRLHSQKLLDSVMRYEDFPILLEAWRTCLQDEFDMEHLKQVLAKLEAGAIRWSECRTPYPSPMAQSITWRQTNQYVYLTDEPAAGTTSHLRSDLLNHVVFTPGIRPRVARELADGFQRKRQRLAPGYSTETPREMVDWVKERLLIPASEWDLLLQAVQRDHEVDTGAMMDTLAERLAWITPPGASGPLVVALEELPRLSRALYGGQDVPVKRLVGDAGVPATGLAPGPSEGDPDETLTTILGQWLQFYGPFTFSFVRSALGMEQKRLSLALEDLVDSRQAIVGTLVEGDDEERFCDSENFEALLRATRASAVPIFEPLGPEWLPLFLAQHQGLTAPADDVEGLFGSIEQLLCLPLPAQLWEAEVLPARVQTYSTAWLDSIMQESDLRWVGAGNRRVVFCFQTDLDLMTGDGAAPTDTEESLLHNPRLSDIFPGPLGRYDFFTLHSLSGYSTSELSRALWELAWQGRVTNDTFAVLRRGIENQFRVPKVAEASLTPRRRGRHAGSRASFARWKGSLPYAGNWFRLPSPEPGDDPLEAEERAKDRARLLLDRHGILFRELLEREAPPFRWGGVFRALRLMELSGEVLAGYFFHGIPGPQFISHQAFRRLQRRLPEDCIYWLNAADPASMCGVLPGATKNTLPRRSATTHLVYHGTRLVVVSTRHGRAFRFHVPPDHERLTEYLGFLHHLLTRQFQPLRRVVIETINGEDAARSPYVDMLTVAFDVATDYKNVVLYRKTGPGEEK